MTGNQLADMSPRVAELRSLWRIMPLRPLSLAQLGGLVSRHPCLSGIFSGADIFEAMVNGGRPVLHDVLALASGRPAASIRTLRLSPRKLVEGAAMVLAMTLPAAPEGKDAGETSAPCRRPVRDAWAHLAARLVSLGHADPLRYSPRQALAWIEAGEEARKVELKETASAMLVAGRGDKNDIKRFMEQ